MITSLMKMDSSSSCNQQSSHGIMDEKGVHDAISYESDISSVVSSESDLFEEVNSSESSSPISPTSDGSTSSSSGQHSTGPLQDMSSLLQELPFKRGLSKHYNGKSQSFTSLANVRSLEDLAKPENPYTKKLKSCRSYGGFLENHGSNHPARSSSSSKLISNKKASSRGSCSSLCVKRNSSFIGNRPPNPPPHRSSSRSCFTTQTSLFALGI